MREFERSGGSSAKDPGTRKLGQDMLNDCEMVTPARKTLNGEPPEFKVEPKQPMAVAQKQASDPVMMKFSE